MSEQFFHVRERVCDGSHIREYAGCTAGSQEHVLQLHIRQYVPLDLPDPPPPHAITIISSPCLAFPKECYEPLWDEIYGLCKRQGVFIRGVWAVDAANDGKSYALNDRKLSTMDAHAWEDHARDLLMVINHFRASMPRPLVAIGHSMGANILADRKSISTNVAYMHPRLFTTLILLDPCIDPELPRTTRNNDISGPARYNVAKPDIWTHREAAMKTFEPVSKAWDPRCLQLMARHGFCETPTILYPEPPNGMSSHCVTLTTPKSQELMNMLRLNTTVIREDGSVEVNRATHADIHPKMYSMPLYRSEALSAWLSLPKLRPSAIFLIGERTFLHFNEVLQGVMKCGTGVGGSGGIAKDKVKLVTVPHGSHFFPFEKISYTAEKCCEWLEKSLKDFNEEQEAWEAGQSTKTARDHLVLPQEWLDVLKSPASTAKGASKL